MSIAEVEAQELAREGASSGLWHDALRRLIRNPSAVFGALLVSMASQNVLSLTWEMSTSMPRRFISATTCLPNGVRPLCFGSSPEESAQLFVLVCVSVM